MYKLKSRSIVLDKWRALDMWLKPTADYLGTSPSLRLLATVAAVFGFVVLVLTTWQIREDLRDRADERQIRRDEAIARAWERLLLPVGGNTGKGGAMSVLSREGVSLEGLDVSCKSLGRWDEALGCQLPPIISGAVLSGDLGRRGYADMNWSGDAITNLTIDHAWFLADLRGARIFWLTVRGGTFGIDCLEATIVTSDILGADFYCQDGYPAFYSVNVSGSQIVGLESFSDDQLHQMWFWADWPPRKREPSRMQSLQDIDSARGQLPLDLNWGLRTTSKMHICRPPQDGDGNIIPIETRPVMFSAATEFRCQNIGAWAAQRHYPNAYVTKQTVLNEFELFGLTTPPGAAEEVFLPYFELTR